MRPEQEKRLNAWRELHWTERNYAPVVVICPASVSLNWQREGAKMVQMGENPCHCGQERAATPRSLPHLHHLLVLVGRPYLGVDGGSPPTHHCR